MVSAVPGLALAAILTGQGLVWKSLSRIREDLALGDFTSEVRGVTKELVDAVGNLGTGAYSVWSSVSVVDDMYEGGKSFITDLFS